jgi:hypothetical protein
LAQAASYLFLLTDKAPIEKDASPVRFDVTPQGQPTPGGVLLRIILVIPHAIVLFFIGIVAFILMIVAAIMVLVQEKYPEGIFNFLRGDMRWNVRVFVYLAGFAQEYPPFAFDGGPEGGAAIAAPTIPNPPPTSSTGAQS